MKNGTLYAGKLKKLFTRLRQSHGKPAIPEPDDPLRRLALAILGIAHGESKAAAALDRLFTAMVDWNEVRVSSAIEVATAVSSELPDAHGQCQQLVSALRSVYKLENMTSLDRLRSMGRREAKHYLENLDGVDEFAVASVFLWSLGGHAVPADDKALASLRAAGVVDPGADRATVQAFLERHISAADAKEFTLLLRLLSPNEAASGKTRTASNAKAKRKRREDAA